MSIVKGSEKGNMMKKNAKETMRSVSMTVIIILASMIAAQNCLAQTKILSDAGSPATVVVRGETGGEEKTTGPVIQSALFDLPEMPDEDPDPDIVQVTIDVRMAPVNVNGVTANLFTYNGLVPGPVIRTKTGDILRIHFQNSLPLTSDVNMLGFTKNVTNLHVHGMHVTPVDPGDNVALEILPGQTHDYEYDLMMQRPGCLNFYHTHAHGLVAEQYFGGLVGPIIVDDPTPALDGIETRILVLKDISLSGTSPSPHSMMMEYMHGKEGSIVMVNGQVNPSLTTQPGEVQRWRILNASNARFYKLSLENHSLNLIGTDGGLLDKPYPQSYILLSPGERVDVMIQSSSGSGNYRLLALPYARIGTTQSSQVTLMTMTVAGAPVADVLPTVIDPSAARIDIDTTGLTHRTYELTMMGGRAMINGNDFDMMPDMTMSTLGDYEVWTITNPSGMMGMSMDHPWHQHVNAGQVISITGGDAAYAALYTTIPAMKDVTIVPKGGSVSLLIPVLDWAGMTMYHCHILEHEDIGMMGMWDITGSMPMMPAEVTGTIFCPDDKTCMSWDPCSNATSYEIYEGGPGDLPALLTGDMDSCLRWSGSGVSTGSTLAQDPPSGSFSWYLVVGCNGMMKGSAGNATAGERILNGMGPCM